MLSVVLAYYRQPEALRWQLDFFEKYPREQLELIVVDDASNDGLAEVALRSSIAKVTLVTLLRDIPWNIPGARNWGMVFAQGPTCLRTDIDHRPTAEAMSEILDVSLPKREAWTFERVDASGRLIHPHTDSFLIRKDDYWESGGYDEALSGAYGQNAKDFTTRAGRLMTIRPSQHRLETMPSFLSGVADRSLGRNRRRLARLEKRGDRRRIKRLDTDVRVTHFNR